MTKKLTLFALLVVLMFGFMSVDATAGSPFLWGKKKSDLAGLNPKVYELAIKARSKALAKGEINKADIITVIDYSKPSTQKRLWVIDLSSDKVLFHTYVAHGRGTGENHAKYFSNASGSYQSSLGVFKTGGLYMGGHGKTLYIHGLEEGINSNAYSRSIVMHGAHYVSAEVAKKGRLGRSHGCPAVPDREVGPIINTIQNGSLMFVYYPDQKWLSNSSYL